MVCHYRLRLKVFWGRYCGPCFSFDAYGIKELLRSSFRPVPKSLPMIRGIDLHSRPHASVVRRAQRADAAQRLRAGEGEPAVGGHALRGRRQGTCFFLLANYLAGA